MDKNCKACKLGCGRAVPSHGPAKPKLMVISDYPGSKESELGLNMVGKSGQLLRDALKNIVGLDPEQDVYYANIIRCEPVDGAKTIGKAEINSCKKFTLEDIKTVNPDVILIAGNLAFQTILAQLYAIEKDADSGFSLSRAHGSAYEYLGKTYFVTWNPAHVEQYKFKRRVGGTDRRPLYEDWYPTGSEPWMFINDMKKLKAILEESRERVS
jgi:uracil-DNA glycosylase family 4